MKSFKEKKEDLAGLGDKLSRAKITVFTTFARAGEKGLNVKKLRELKKDLQATDSLYLVEKKTILDKALKNSKASVDVFSYEGSVGVVLGYGDEQSVAKSVYNFARKNAAFKYFGALWGGKFMALSEFTEFAKLPSREVMLARLFGMMKYPLSVLTNILDQISKSKTS